MQVGEEYYYKECLRNHAASLGSYATDGCGEFTPSDTGGTLLSQQQCAACGCHRNFHRRLTLISSSDGVSCGDNLNPVAALMTGSPQEIRCPKKRLRTKFTTEQKERMFEFAEKLEWKMPRGREEGNAVEAFCKGIGVSKKVFKVWMHNHKNNSSYSSST